MGADLSRVRFDALRDHSGVVMQQGRLLLDADWNELVAIVDRRLRAAAADLGTTRTAQAIAGAAVVPRTTPDAFRIAVTATPELSIGRGRMYVDGLLAENHGTGALVHDPLLAGPARADDTPYGKQPYWPAPAPLPASGTHLVYLDVWQREVTALQEPDLVEAAVGVDTTARTQTVWQVRAHAPDTPGLSCATADADITGWPDVIAPSAGRLTTGTFDVAPTDDPCALPPSGGYRGLENQTYRVEIHTGGPVGDATFKWSRDNGSVAVPVAEIVSAQRLRPADLGRDAVLGLRTGDWVEILDDHRELAQEPGEMRRITVHDDGTVTFASALPADLPTTTEQGRERHLRIRRWDQSGRIRTAAGTDLDDLDAAGSTGVIKVPAQSAAVVLENGITVALRAPGGRFRTGDHWIFAARTDTTSFAAPRDTTGLDALVDAPPLGVHHHYARLAVVTLPDTVSDCRTPWPPPDSGGDCGDCTVCVTPESHASGALTVQAAVDRVTRPGGTVCLAAGVYRLDRPVGIRGARSVRVHGQGPATLLIAADGGFEVRDCAYLTLEDFALVSGGRLPGIALAATAMASVCRTTVLMVPRGEEGGAGPAFELSGASLFTRLQDNTVYGPVGIASPGDGGPGLLTAGLEIGDNLLVCRDTGILFGGQVAHAYGNRVHGNTVLRSEGTGIQILGTPAPGGSCEITGNTVYAAAAGIEVAPGGYTVSDNTVLGTEEARQENAHGIAVRPGPSGVLRGPTRVSANRVSGFGGTGIAVRAPVGDLDVSHNAVERVARGIVVEERGRTEHATVTGNTVRDTGGPANDPLSDAVGIQVVGADHALVESNTLLGIGTRGKTVNLTAGVRLLACRQSQVRGNIVEGFGALDGEARCVGIQLAGFAQTLVEGNTSRRTRDDVDAGGVLWTGLLIGDEVDDPKPPRIVHFGAYIQVTAGATARLIGRETAFALTGTDRSATVGSNTLTGGIQAPAARIAVAGDVVVTANQCRQHLKASAPAISVLAVSATLSANRARGGRPSIRLAVDNRRLALLGNVTTNGIVTTGGLDPQWPPLNPDGVP